MTSQSYVQITPKQLQQIGAAFVTIVGVQYGMGHSSAACTASEYLNRDDLTGAQQLVRDVLASCTYGDHPAEETRIAEFLRGSGVQRKIASGVML